MKKIKWPSFRITFIFLISSVFVLSGCTKNFPERNTDPTKLTALTQQDLRGLFSNAEWQGFALGGGTQYQRGVNAFADMYAQYFAVTQTAFASDRFDLTQSRLQNHWIRAYVFTMPSLLTIIKTTTSDETRAVNAIARIWKAFILLRVTDYYGPIPYFNIGSSDKTISYDAQKDIYYDLFKEVTEATADLASHLNSISFSDQDQIFAGDNSKWLKFGNTLRLRMALRISQVDPDKAKAEAEAAVVGGVMTDVADDGYL
ncbi:MAG TPA: SusD/RagB family nutrient-binding outer membrane lipoprotein, partial [Flavitalea sp.]|nr:SusD/RagB family nutrient-binding outer membrane lipoprotein [Flavitalea sp.]